MIESPLVDNNSRIALHWYNDFDHFREADFIKWLPEFEQMHIDWLVIPTPANIAIPEYFIQSLKNYKIEPVLHIDFFNETHFNINSLSTLFKAYARWGVNYIILFDRPNMISSWDTYRWTKSDLVEYFLDISLPIMKLAINNNLTPIFPPLVPGGDYWDTSFLQQAMTGIIRRSSSDLLRHIALSVYIDLSETEKPIDWGRGGSNRWPGAKPYITPQGQQNHRGFFIYEWYDEIARATMGDSLPIFMIDSNCKNQNDVGNLNHEINNTALNQRVLKISNMCQMIHSQDNSCENFPSYIKAVTFPSLINYPILTDAVDALRENNNFYYNVQNFLNIEQCKQQKQRKLIQNLTNKKSSMINHYLLLPTDKFDITEQYLNSIQPFFKQFKPTVGFSLQEAILASKVTVVGGTQDYSKLDLDKLVNAGCKVERFVGDGTSFASNIKNQ